MRFLWPAEVAWAEDGAAASLLDRVAALFRVPRHHLEGVQILRYRPGERYMQHVDYFNLTDYVGQDHYDAIAQRTRYGVMNRLATVLVQLSPRGGPTNFPQAAQGAVEYQDCSRGVNASAAQGGAVIFFSLRGTGSLEPLSQHAGCPSAEEKWIATVWVWSGPVFEPDSGRFLERQRLEV